MDLILDLVRKLVLVTVFASFGELLLPSGRFRSFVRFGVGLVIIAFMLQPLASLRGINIDLEKLLGGENEVTFDPGGKVWVQEQTKELVEAQLASEILRYLSEYPQWCAQVKVNVEFDGQGFLKSFTGMEVDLYPPGAIEGGITPIVIGEFIESRDSSPPPGLATRLAQLLGIPEEKLVLRFWAGGKPDD